MQITLDAKTLEMPENMPLKAELAWRYFNINDTCGWIAVEAGCIGVLLTDESGDLDCISYIFATVARLVCVHTHQFMFRRDTNAVVLR